MFFMSQEKSQMVQRDQALPGRYTPIATAPTHFLTGRPLQGPLGVGLQEAMFGMGCFWGVERMFWGIEGVWVTMVGYAAGYTPNPTYEEVCTGKTGHNEVVRVIFDPAIVTYEALLKVFWEGHDPSQGMRQGNDCGTQYRSGIYTYGTGQAPAATASLTVFAEQLKAAGFGAITSEILPAPQFYYAEDYHQQYLAKNPNGYCGIGGTGVTCPIGLAVT
ncbi:peptide-methionine (S)-S-oxide reductase MsrA [Planktomarina sp.]|uniref:peptide-methionine (S)-S-oxide reductase MsrA n=1 Tax=Planktomarina sp. TaxID=2024851 RepID=UPI00288F85DE|nr:peptide-methionine (S)-S-oxide reductase MsrA [Planktomarina sp.]MDT2070667.1 peptide-methionine (S)-S-oxide reductase MsrA [Planktomarina sp.]